MAVITGYLPAYFTHKTVSTDAFACPCGNPPLNPWLVQ
jgi:hypothetical protein